MDYGRPTRFDGAPFASRRADGSRFDPRDLSVAHPTLPLGTCLALTYRGRTLLVHIRDRGPCTTSYCRSHAPPRIRARGLDLTPAVARALRFPGLATLSYRRVPC